jgi:predicted secreted protein
MGPVAGTVAFACIWMISLFLVLPWGIRNPHETGQEIVQGTDPGAPVAPRMLLKVGITTIVAVVIWTALFVVMEYRLLTLDDFPF